MLNYRTLESKPKINLTNGNGTAVECLDLLADPTYESIILPIWRVVVVTEDYVARPDLISLAVYGNDSYGDIICKYNNISNPFELGKGMLIKIPKIEGVFDFIEGKAAASELAKENESLHDVEINAKMLNEMRSPNEQTVGDRNYIIDKTNQLIFY